MDNLETSLVKDFKDREFAKHSLQWVGSYRLDGINAVESLGLPNLTNEDWRFTSLKDFANRNFSPYISKTLKYNKPELPDYINNIDGYFLYVHNGELVFDYEYPFLVQGLKSSFDYPEVKKVLLDNTSTKNKD